MWYITQCNFPGGDLLKTYCCDGQPILGPRRGPEGSHYRIMAGTAGYLDIIDTGHQLNGPHWWSLSINGQTFWYDGNGSVELTFNTNGTFTATGDGNTISGKLTPIPRMEDGNAAGLQKMLTMGIVPYLDPPSGTPKSNAGLKALADQYFPGDPYGFDMAMALYDWTTSSFIRQDLFHQLQYTSMEGHPLDLPTIARVIWNCDYPGYSAKDANFMNQFAMKPATSEADVYNQLLGVYETIKPLAMAEMNVQILGLLGLAQPTTSEYPQLYRGAMPMSGGYDTSNFSPSLFEFAGNNGPRSDPLMQDLSTALDGVLAEGNIITTKGPWSFSNDLEGAKVWQNGILITCNPPEGSSVWPGCADITNFSLNPDTFEINVAPVTRYRIDHYEWIKIQGKPVCSFTMTMLGYCCEPY